MAKKRLVVLDDDKSVADFVRTVAEVVGFDAISVHDSQKFFQMLDNAPDVIVLDLVMPDTDGVQVIRELAERGCKASLILATGFDEHVLFSVRNLALKRGLDVLGTLQKPLTYEAIESLLLNISQPTHRKVRGDAPPFAKEDLARAMEAGEIFTAFQPQVDMRNKSIVGYEALSRWRHPDRGLILPQAFIPIAEKTGLIESLTELVLNQAMIQASLWRQAGLDMPVAVNMSVPTLANLDLPERILGLLNRYGLDPNHLILEVTESALMKDVTQSLDTLNRLRIKGISLALDDFGTGYSSMRQLQQVPFIELKIDRSFVSNVDSSPQARAIVESTIGLAHKLGMRVVAEGVETQVTWKSLQKLGCDRAQGFFMSTPLTAEQIDYWHHGWETFAQNI